MRLGFMRISRLYSSEAEAGFLWDRMYTLYISVFSALVNSHTGIRRLSRGGGAGGGGNAGLTCLVDVHCPPCLFVFALSRFVLFLLSLIRSDLSSSDEVWSDSSPSASTLIVRRIMGGGRCKTILTCRRDTIKAKNHRSTGSFLRKITICRDLAEKSDRRSIFSTLAGPNRF